MMLRLLSASSRMLSCAAPRNPGQVVGSRGLAASASAAPVVHKISAAPMVYVSGEEMTRYTMQLVLDKWVHPHVDTSKWDFYDLRAKNRDDTEDQVLRDVIAAGNKLKAIFKEPTITPTAGQVKRLGLKKAWGSPNGAMRRGWNGITISRDTIHIDGVELGYKNPVFFERHAVGGEYSAGYKLTGRGKLTTTFVPEGCTDAEAIVVDQRDIVDAQNAVVTYHNPYDNVYHLARIFFGRCLAAGITPYVVTKKTVFKWQEPFWQIMKEVFDADYKAKFVEAKIMAPGAELTHFLSDAATMKLVVWTDGGFGMAAHNYDGDVLTDELAQVHMSPGFITSNLVGVDEHGVLIKEFEASHGTVTDMDDARLRGEETSLNPLGMVEGLMGAMNHAADIHGGADEVHPYTAKLRAVIHKLFREGRGTRDLCGAGGLTTEQFIDAVADELKERWGAGRESRAAADLDVHVAVDRTQDPGPRGRGGARMQRTNAVKAARAAGGERARNADGMEALTPGGSGSSQTDNLVNTLHLQVAQMLAF
eukprot:CAMPEP_0198682688 /NCGR_PEP_ID=MMETSP1468-20131203/9221_1 /TAXON_ID=1461545 /ORGANISM="Mantoniella sp, Strain CCMP1436" /LENGTH=533 /DNA_ID=CAMNT_0044425935 /DNA_START=149 /DNA_END=1751 /DNA_ORIENTATION=+